RMAEAHVWRYDFRPAFWRREERTSGAARYERAAPLGRIRGDLSTEACFPHGGPDGARTREKPEQERDEQEILIRGSIAKRAVEFPARLMVALEMRICN
ncbi:MAG: hypothetical protein WB813_06895, partial [Candidatus Acidiferrales bacterium]